MKIRILLLASFCLLTTIIKAQNNINKGFLVEEPLFTNYYSPDIKKAREIEKLMLLEKQTLTNLKANGFYMRKYKSKKPIEKITFELNGLKLYCAGQINYKIGKGLSGQSKNERPIVDYEVYPSSDVKYQSNDQIFSKIENFENHKLKLGSTIYNEDGSYMYHLQKNDDNSTTAISYHEKGKLNFKIVISPSKTELTELQSEKTGNYYPNYHYSRVLNGSGVINYISTTSKDASIIELENGDNYSGFSSLGTYSSKKFGDFTGYLYPMQENIGNATVLFREFDNKHEWVLLVDNQIEMTIPTTKEEKPDIGELQSNLYNTIAFTRHPKYENKPNDSYKFVLASINFGEYKSKNINTINGYGVNYYTKQSEWVGDQRFLEVGFFKNGKLNGLGYACTITQEYKTDKPWVNTTRDENTSNIVEKVIAMAGIFKDGILTDGRNITVPNNNQQDVNYWSKNKVPGVDWVKRKNTILEKNNITDYKVDYNKNTIGMVHVEKLGYNFNIKRIDNNKKAIVIDVDGKEVYLTKESGPVYYTYLNKNQVRVGCNPTKYVKTYKEIDVVKQVPGYKYETRKVNGAFVDYYYTTKTTNTDTYSYKKTVFDEYKTIPNPDCPNGYKMVSNNVWLYEEIKF